MIMSHRQTQSRRRSPLRAIALIIGVLVLLDIITFCIAEGLWFQELQMLPVFWRRLQVQAGLSVLIVGISWLSLQLNLTIAQRWAWPATNKPDMPPHPGQMRFRHLLPIVLILSMLIGALAIDYGQLALQHWHPSGIGSGITLPRPTALQGLDVRHWLGVISAQPWLILALGVGAIALLIYPYPVLSAIALLISLGFGLVGADHWPDVLLFFNPTSFAEADPIFHRNIGFYIFQLPILQLLAFWWVGLASLILLGVGLVYLLSGNSLSNGYFPGLTRLQRRHLLVLGSGWLMAIAFSDWVTRYELLYSRTGVIYGAGYTDVAVRLPVYTGLSSLSLLLGLGLLIWAVTDDRWRLPLSYLPRAIALYGVIVVLASNGLPLVVQRLIVQPNELERERPYLEQAIALTRTAFNLDEIEEETFNPQGNLTYEALQANQLTVKNIRLWDTRPLLETNRQLQRIRPYYEFPGADIDRYTLIDEDGTSEQQQVLIAARELDYASVPEDAKTWVNEHLTYTHGYGFTMSPVNTAGEGGLPDYLIRGIEMSVSSPRIRNSIPIGQPRIYYGELTNTYVMTNTQVPELDYPSGSDNVYNTYDGRGGIPIRGFWRRLLLAKHLRDWRMVLSENLTPQAKLMYRRSIKHRVKAIAPFLHYDHDPYLVVADAEEALQGSPATGTPRSSRNYLYWMIDAYTTSDRYPYSDPLSRDFNYIRNSVKVVVDAYNGSVYFFTADNTDPIITSWNRIFPGMFRSIATMPTSLLSHIRYPQDLFQVQSDHLMVFHMTDPQVFYNREDQWRAPRELYGDEAQLVKPYYLIMKLPAAEREEFILLRPFTPSQRNNLIAWLAARSDRVYQPERQGNSANTMLLYRFPKQELVFGPEQIEARINQDPIISQRISLWNQRGSSAVQGNLLVIPIDQSLLYIEPLYLEATINQLPTLARVIGAYENRIVMAETLDQTLQALFQPANESETIIRDLADDDLAPLLEGGTPP